MTPAERVKRITDEAVGRDLSSVEKTCIRCGEKFSGNRCKACNRARAIAYYNANKDRQQAKALDYYHSHKEKRKEYRAQYYIKNREKECNQATKWAIDNQKRRQESRRKWRAKNLALLLEKSAQYRRDHPEAKRISEQNRRVKKRAGGGRLSRGLTAMLFKLQKGKCACCGLPLGNDYHLDHIMPLFRGGLNTDSNMQLLRAKCNHEKHAKHPVDFMQERGFLL